MNLLTSLDFGTGQVTDIRSDQYATNAIIDSTSKCLEEPVFLNVYNLLGTYRIFNSILKCCTCHSLGAYHTSVQIYDVEYYFGNGICKSRPPFHLGQLVLSKKVGMTSMAQEDIEDNILSDMQEKFTPLDYDLLRHNCNHFTDVFLYRLLGIHLPVQFNRTERCLVAIPCCIRTLNTVLGNNWTRPITEITLRSNRKPTPCCLRAAKRSLKEL